MRKISNSMYHGQMKFFVEVENEDEDLDVYEGDLDVFVIYEPENDLKYVDEIYINHLFKEGEEIKFVKQEEIPQKVRDAILEYVKYEV